jgi:hypothetical protein
MAQTGSDSIGQQGGGIKADGGWWRRAIGLPAAGCDERERAVAVVVLDTRAGSEDRHGHGTRTGRLVAEVAGGPPCSFRAIDDAAGRLDPARLVDALDALLGTGVRVACVAAHGSGPVKGLDHVLRRLAGEVLVVAAAGNGVRSLDDGEHLWSGCEGAGNLLLVAALAEDGTRQHDSNWGARTVALAAPGEAIALPGEQRPLRHTSSACAIVAGAASRVQARWPMTEPPEIVNVLRQAARRDRPWLGDGMLVAAGALDLARALGIAAEAPRSGAFVRGIQPIDAHLHAPAGTRPEPLRLHVDGARALRVRFDRVVARANRGVAIAGDGAGPNGLPELLTGPVTALGRAQIDACRLRSLPRALGEPRRQRKAHRAQRRDLQPHRRVGARFAIGEAVGALAVRQRRARGRRGQPRHGQCRQRAASNSTSPIGGTASTSQSLASSRLHMLAATARANASAGRKCRVAALVAREWW